MGSNKRKKRRKVLTFISYINQDFYISYPLQLSYHPGHDELICHVINQAFRHFKYREGYVFRVSFLLVTDDMKHIWFIHISCFACLFICLKYAAKLSIIVFN